ncbi:hypothetical protein D3C74_465090 [compost metagenome]
MIHYNHLLSADLVLLDSSAHSISYKLTTFYNIDYRDASSSLLLKALHETTSNAPVIPWFVYRQVVLFDLGFE